MPGVPEVVKLLAWLDRISLPAIALPALLLALLPFFPEPHLWQKLKMLAAGTLERPIDIFDLFLHGTLLILLAIKLIRHVAKGR
jgi:hypothetical protein